MSRRSNRIKANIHGTIVPPTGNFVPEVWADSIMGSVLKNSGALSPTDVVGQLMTYVVRLRHSVPFPCDHLDAYLSCFPAWFKEYVDADYFTRINLNEVPTETRNVLQLFHVKEPSPLRGGRVDLSVRSKALFVIEGAGRDSIFWLGFGFTIPRPKDFNDEVIVPAHSEYFERIQSWHRLAVRVEEEISSVHEQLKKLAPWLTVPGHAKVIFPELLNFIKYPNQHTPWQLAGGVEERLHAAGHESEMSKKKTMILNCLSAALMLPEDKPLMGWVGHVGV